MERIKRPLESSLRNETLYLLLFFAYLPSQFLKIDGRTDGKNDINFGLFLGNEVET